MASAMASMLGVVLGNERLMNLIGDEQAVDLLNMVIRYMGLPRDYRMRNTSGGLPPQQQLLQVLQALQAQIMQQVGDGIKPMVEQIAGLGQNVQALAVQTQANSEQIAQQAVITSRLSDLIKVAMTSAPPLPPGPLDAGLSPEAAIPPAAAIPPEMAAGTGMPPA